MKFLIDNQLPPALSRFLTCRGLESVHVSEIDLANASDRHIWTCAVRAIVWKETCVQSVNAHLVRHIEFVQTGWHKFDMSNLPAPVTHR